MRTVFAEPSYPVFIVDSALMEAYAGTPVVLPSQIVSFRADISGSRKANGCWRDSMAGFDDGFAAYCGACGLLGTEAFDSPAPIGIYGKTTADERAVGIAVGIIFRNRQAIRR